VSVIQAALISALTSALVALLIEYTAKPKLEVRKDRLLAAARERREAIGLLGNLVGDASVFDGAYTRREFDAAAERVTAMLKKHEDVSYRHAGIRRVLNKQERAITDDAVRTIAFVSGMLEYAVKRGPTLDESDVDAVLDPLVRQHLSKLRAAASLAAEIYGNRSRRRKEYRKLVKTRFDLLTTSADNHSS
jgi:hypothetical protein